MAVSNGGGHAQHVVPAVDESVGFDRVPEEPSRGRVATGCGETPQSLIGEVADPGRESQTDEVKQAEDEVGIPCRVGGVFLDVEIRFVVEDGIEDERGFSYRGGDQPRAVLAVLVRRPGVDGGARAGVIATHGSCRRVPDGEGKALTIELEDLVSQRKAQLSQCGHEDRIPLRGIGAAQRLRGHASPLCGKVSHAVRIQVSDPFGPDADPTEML